MQQTETSRLKISDNTKNTSLSPGSVVSDVNQGCKSKRFKQFLLANASHNSFQNRPHTAERFTRTSQIHSVKKSTFYRKLLNRSIDHYQKSQNFTCVRRTIQNAKKSDESGIIFKDTIPQNHKRNFTSRAENNLKRKEGSSDIKKTEYSREQIKSFESFLDLKKKQFKQQIRNSVANTNTIDVEGEKQSIDDPMLTIQGNHKQLKPKQLVNSSKKAKKIREQAKKNSINSIKHTKNPELNSSHQFSSKNISPKKITNPPQSPQKRQTSLVQNNNLQNASCFKNLYSPFNGIQIKYQSSQSQDLFPNPLSLNTKKLIIKSFPRLQSRNNKLSYFPRNITKGIVFRQKSNFNGNDQNQIDGWKVKQQINEQILDDLCYQS